MKIDSTSTPHSSSVSSPDIPRDSAAASNARKGQRQDFAERLQHPLQELKLSPHSSVPALSFPDSARIGLSTRPRPNLRNLFEDAVPLTKALSDSYGISSSSHSRPAIQTNKPPLSPSGYRTIADNKATSNGNVQRTAKTYVTPNSAAIGSVDTRPVHAVRAGENVITAAARFGINNDWRTEELEAVSIATHVPGFVRQAARLGLDQAVANFAQQYGITTNAGLTRLQSTATQHFALHEIENGWSAQSVIKQFSITDKGSIYQLTQAEARAVAGSDLNGGNTKPPAPTTRRALLPATSGGLAAYAVVPAADESYAQVKDQL